ncbi:hypothetical protein OKA05_10670 [Luteolibacter arcticus]|uniref:Uncharacterized protein n=1 Tax=Luteolibacter arcticus TaxID=1581411 RepID=A0ABT3GHK4_9BACT|nr:hypothetical protein [Luteolibacter arcticus]MCW1923016.1 hypothetical protein [Luteolibacter arcticus]
MWQDDYLLEIRKIDRDQSPHGLYGLREVLSPGKWLWSQTKVLGGEIPETNVAGRLGWGRQPPVGESISFTAPLSAEVILEVESHASTKVRHFGNSYLLDKVHGKKVEEGSEILESAVPKLAKSARIYGGTVTHCLLFIAHVPSPERFDRLLGKTNSEAFLDRYSLTLHSLMWKDIYDRDFHTGLFLWSALSGGQ